jgi:hypothetical protein
MAGLAGLGSEIRWRVRRRSRFICRQIQLLVRRIMPIEDELLLEEFRWVKARLEAHEKRYFEMLILAAGSLAATLGLADKVPHELLPIGLGMVLVTAVHFASINRVLQSYASAYLLERFNRRFSSVNYEQMHADLSAGRSRFARTPLYLRIRRTICDPIVGVVVSYGLISFFFGRDFVLVTGTSLYPLLPSAYVAILSAFFLQLIRSVIESNRNGISEIRSEVSAWHRAKLGAVDSDKSG